MGHLVYEIKQAEGNEDSSANGCNILVGLLSSLASRDPDKLRAELETMRTELGTRPDANPDLADPGRLRWLLSTNVALPPPTPPDQAGPPAVPIPGRSEVIPPTIDLVPDIQDPDFPSPQEAPSSEVAALIQPQPGTPTGLAAVVQQRPLAVAVGGFLAVSLVVVGLIVALDPMGLRKPALPAAPQPGQPQAQQPAGNQDSSPNGPFRVFLEPALNGPGRSSPSCNYNLGLRFDWPQSPPYRAVVGQDAVIALSGPGLPPSVTVKMAGNGETYVDRVGSLTKANPGTFTATLQTVGGRPAAEAAGQGSQLSSTVANPCG
ncbi:MAG: hypothetical protein QOE92_226 [Chloroflexota bacterium]|nr:hypothetical protein [Chloroflexota bacterium]